ncbi:MAG: DeoR/GlpR transcriptional regulator [Tessaracoccus sp.]|uniref:DeoR/GlpR family DNA-binding transcription regulator n=1 Tax=Tessaracoccus sp. TaxID=1971211 RepID=UPI001ECEFCE4|nr:DeoR/GlpR family DNA-binding transcription regulator [Tessaracoccus sp.]MBK7822705.1 DeoR/GlpR transcriptional regulator [Tessaracoccus sp.]
MTQGSPILPASVRREQIVSIVERQGFARVTELSRAFQVSEVTIRTDLDALAVAHVIERVHGGAVAGHRALATEPALELAMTRATSEKRRIGHAAAAMVTRDQSVLIDAGSTTTAVARALLARDDLSGVVVFTNSLTIAFEFERGEQQFTVGVTGGTVRHKQHSLVDPLGDMFMGLIRGDICFIGCNGVSAEGVTNSSMPEVIMKKRFMESSRKRVLVADSTKIGRTQLARVAPLSDIDLLITGVETPEANLEPIREAGVAVQQV